MKAAELSERPGFSLIKQSDVLSFYHMQMPRWLFSSAAGKKLSLEAKVAYTFLLNRCQLSRLNSWVNADNEVFVIFTRESLAEEMGISYRKAIDCFKELSAAKLIWEKRVGRGNANQIYLAAVEFSESEAAGKQSAPFVDADQNAELSRPAETASLESVEEPVPQGLEENQDLPDSHIQTCQNCTSRSADSAVPDLPDLQPSNYTIPSRMDKNRNAKRIKAHMCRHIQNVKTHKCGQWRDAKIPIHGQQ